MRESYLVEFVLEVEGMVAVFHVDVVGDLVLVGVEEAHDVGVGEGGVNFDF